MWPIATVSEVLAAIQGAKAGASAFCTNFFPTEARLQAWIDHGELVGEVRERAAFFLRKDRGFGHLYFSAGDLESLRKELVALPELKADGMVIDLVGNEAGLKGLFDLARAAGFRPYARLLRLARTSRPEEQQPPADGPGVTWADPTDCQAITDLLEASFDAYADQIPMPYEIEAAIMARQILTVKCEGTLAALLFFETQGFTSTVRYWAVAARFQSRRLGSVLMRHYLTLNSSVRRFLLWVAANNETAVQKYRHYGYAPDGLIDHVLVNQMIAS